MFTLILKFAVKSCLILGIKDKLDCRIRNLYNDYLQDNKIGKKG